MAEINVKIKGDDEDIKRKFRESEAAGAEFAASIKERFKELKESAADIAGETGFGGIKKVLSGLGGVAIGATIVEGFKKAGEAAIQSEKQINQLRLSLPAAFSGMAESITKWVESVSGGMGSFEENMTVMRALLQSGMGIDEAEGALINLQNAAAKLGISVADLGKAFAEIKALGEVPERFWKEFPALAPIARRLGMPEKPSAQWMLQALLPNIMPGGLGAPGRMQTEATVASQLDRFGVEIENVAKELGTELLPTMKQWLAEFKEAIPQIAATAKEFGAALAELSSSLHSSLGWLFSDIAANRYPGQRTVEAMHDMLFTNQPPDPTVHYNLFHDSATALQRSAKAQEEAAEKINKALNPTR